MTGGRLRRLALLGLAKGGPDDIAPAPDGRGRSNPSRITPIISLPERPAVIVPAEPWAARVARRARTDMPPVLSNAARTYPPVYL
jgi:hypothetical protein